MAFLRTPTARRRAQLGSLSGSGHSSRKSYLRRRLSGPRKTKIQSVLVMISSLRLMQPSGRTVLKKQSLIDVSRILFSDASLVTMPLFWRMDRQDRARHGQWAQGTRSASSLINLVSFLESYD